MYNFDRIRLLRPTYSARGTGFARELCRGYPRRPLIIETMNIQQQTSACGQVVEASMGIPLSDVKVRWMARINGSKMIELGSARTEPAGKFTSALHRVSIMPRGQSTISS
jgi:hypothetical protein